MIHSVKPNYTTTCATPAPKRHTRDNGQKLTRDVLHFTRMEVERTGVTFPKYMPMELLQMDLHSRLSFRNFCFDS